MLNIHQKKLVQKSENCTAGITKKISSSTTNQIHIKASAFAGAFFTQIVGYNEVTEVKIEVKIL